jgi:hypothetical protein
MLVLLEKKSPLQGGLDYVLNVIRLGVTGQQQCKHRLVTLERAMGSCPYTQTRSE